MAGAPNEQSRAVGIFGKTRVGRAASVVAGLGAVAIAFVVVVGFVPGSAGGDEPDQVGAVRSEEREEQPRRKRLVGFDDETWEQRAEQMAREEEAYLKSLSQKAADRRSRVEENKNESSENSSKVRIRKVRRFEWESPAETRGKLWNIPEGEGDERTLTAFLRICISEADGHAADCIGIWQVIKNIRRSRCERGHVRRITECEEYTKRDGTTGLRETYLSVMKRASKSVLGVVPPRTKRSQWISEMEIDCYMPPSWPSNQDRWDAQYGSKRCPRVVEMGRYLIKNELPPRRPGFNPQWLPGRPITWGGRCENKRGACDDRIACSRGLARVEQGLTHNAFWCRPGRGCRQDADPICVQMGYGHLITDGEEVTEADQIESSGPSRADSDVVDIEEEQDDDSEQVVEPVALTEADDAPLVDDQS